MITPRLNFDALPSALVPLVLVSAEISSPIYTSYANHTMPLWGCGSFLWEWAHLSQFLLHFNVCLFLRITLHRSFRSHDLNVRGGPVCFPVEATQSCFHFMITPLVANLDVWVVDVKLTMNPSVWQARSGEKKNSELRSQNDHICDCFHTTTISTLYKPIPEIKQWHWESTITFSYLSTVIQKLAGTAFS